MRRSIEFNQQYYADDHGMWMETQAQQNGYAFQQESWSSGNNFHNRFPAMNINKLNAIALDSDLSMSKQHSNKLRAMHMKMLDEFAEDSNLFMSKQNDMLGSMHMKRLGASAYGMDSALSKSKQHDKLSGSMHVNMIGAYGVDSEFSNLKQHGKLGKGHGMFQEGMHREHGFGYGHGGGRKFNNFGGQRECFSEETEVMMVYEEGRVGGGSYQVDPYGRKMIRNINWWT